MRPSAETLAKRSVSLKQAWLNRLDYSHGLAGTPFHNSWRAINFTLKSKRIGVSDRWKIFRHFVEDMHPSYETGLRLCRRDKTQPFSKENCYWEHKDNLWEGKMRLAKLEYKGEIKTLVEWCLQYDLSRNGVNLRYYRHIDKYTPEEILFGRKKKKRKDFVDQSELAAHRVRDKASRMISAYKCKDKKRNWPICAELTIEWMIENILKKACTYCGSTQFVGADRIDNAKPHHVGNMIPCCVRCNTVRGAHFTYEQMLKVGDFIRREIDS